MAHAERNWIDPHATYVHLAPDGTATPVEAGEDFWRKGIRELPPGGLVTAHRFDTDWPQWEMHPRGEELLILLSGAVEIIVEDERGEHTVPLRCGQVYLMRRGVWHRATVQAPADMLFVTFGEGTEHRPR